MILKTNSLEYEGVHWFQLWMGPVSYSCEPSGSVKHWEFLEQPEMEEPLAGIDDIIKENGCVAVRLPRNGTG
jgi:hypothetical protein